ncbi:MAG TPA: hypothetical protein VIJ57_07210 [Hanamia sp.]
MEIAKLVIDLIGKIIWPIVLLVIVWKFRKQIVSRFKDINEIELPGGFKAKLSQVIQATVEEVTDKLDPIFENQIDNSQSYDNNIEIENDADKTLLVLGASQSLKENLKYNIYYDPATRNHNVPFKYIGLYSEKEVAAVGEVMKKVFCDYDEKSKKLIGTNGDDLNELSKDEYNRIKDIIENTPYYDLKSGMKFFLVDKFCETEYIKSSNFPLRAKRYFWLDEIEGFKNNMTSQQLAKFLDGKEWV